ncbi:MAG: murein biosynthesis integral membrane protein MurJ [Firmicutes bacterium ZCTH02-B6]|nr:MAG: murein biosynthesis integral membrane protein MurJ [Firmicutes bacterium ZCTH02-B6]
MSSSRTVARNAGIVMLLILISRLLGFIRERAIADVFGLSWETDAFRAAFNIPDLMYFLLVGGAISSAFIPVFSSYLARGQEDDAWRMAATFITLVSGGLILLTVLGVIFSPWLAPVVAPGFTGAQRDLLVVLMRVMFPAVLFTALAGVGMGVHNAYQRFAVPLLGPIVYNIAITVGAYLLGPVMGIMGMAVGTVAGAVGNFLIQAPFVARSARRFPWRIQLRHPGLLKVVRLMIPTIIGLSIVQLNTIILTALASTLAEGHITALNLANRLIQLPLGVFGMGMSMVIFPVMARLAALGDWQEFSRTLGTGLRTVLFVTVPSAAGLVALGEPIVRLLFEVGAFGPEDTATTAYALWFFGAGVFALSTVQVLTRAFYSLQDTVTPVKIGLLTVVTNTGLSLALLRWTNLLHGGLALAFSAAAIVQMSAQLALLRPKLGRRLDLRALASTFGRAALGSAVMFPAARAAANLAGTRVDLALTSGRLVQVLAGMAAGVLVYGLVAVLLRMEELQLVLAAFRRMARRSS